MLIKELDDRINFIDKNDNFVGIELESKHNQLCRFRWFITDVNDHILDFAGPQKPLPFIDNEGNPINIDELVFDTDREILTTCVEFTSLREPGNENHYLNEHKTWIAVIPLCMGEKWYDGYRLVLANQHNGWYSLGWQSNLVPGVVKPTDNFEQTDTTGTNLAL